MARTRYSALKKHESNLLGMANACGLLLCTENIKTPAWNRLYNCWLDRCFRQDDPRACVSCRLCKNNALLSWSIPSGLRLPEQLVAPFLAMIGGIYSTGERFLATKQRGPCVNWIDGVALDDAELLARYVADYLAEHLERARSYSGVNW